MTIATCPTCGRKTQIIMKTKSPISGKNAGWSKLKHRCEIHGTFEMKVHNPRNGEGES